MPEGLLNKKDPPSQGSHVMYPKKLRGKEVHIQSNMRSNDFEDIAIFMR